MARTLTLVLPPRLWRQDIPGQLGGATMMFAVALRRNEHPSGTELIAVGAPVLAGRDGLPGPPVPADHLTISLNPSSNAAQARQRVLAGRLGPGRTVAALLLSTGSWSGRWAGMAWDRGTLVPVDHLRLVGPGMLQFDRVPRGEPVAEPDDRWVRTRGAEGELAWAAVRRSRVAVIGAGRNGAGVAQGMALAGVASLLLVDPDRDERHNLDGLVLPAHAGLGRPKVVNRREALHDLRPDLPVEALSLSVLHPEAVEALRSAELLVTAVDHDTPRLAAATLANRWAKPHLDIGTAVLADGARRRKAADVRLCLPGEACVVCLGGLRRIEDARIEMAAPAGALRRGPYISWDRQRLGSLVSLNTAAVGLGVDLWLELLAGRLTGSHWLHLEWPPLGGAPTLTSHTEPEPSCTVCRART